MEEWLQSFGVGDVAVDCWSKTVFYVGIGTKSVESAGLWWMLRFYLCIFSLWFILYFLGSAYIRGLTPISNSTMLLGICDFLQYSPVFSEVMTL